MENVAQITIDNCCDCGHSKKKRIYTSDSFEHLEGLYCTKCSDKLITSDDKDVRKYAQIPDWCPFKG